jgi:integrase
MLMALTDITLREAKPKEKAYKLTDAGGLYLWVAPTGLKSWRMKYRFQGKEKILTIGKYPQTSLKQARNARADAKALLSEGIDPSAHKQAIKHSASDQSATTFKDAAIRWHELNTPRWTPRYALKVWQMTDKRLVKELGNKPLNTITSAATLTVLRKMENEGIGETTRKVKNYLTGIFAYAIAEGHIENNPVTGITPALKAVPPAKHQRSLPFAMMGDFISAIEADQGHPVVKLGLTLLLLTMTRTGEVRFATWDEIDWSKRQWLIPAARMKMKADHLIPLSDQAITVLKQLQALTGHTRYIVRSPNTIDKPLSENAFLVLIKRIGFTEHTTAHGLRATASTVLNEAGFRPDVIEKQLAHEERNQVRKAYNRADYLEERRDMLQWWADNTIGTQG